jgi:hypothetical protein
LIGQTKSGKQVEKYSLLKIQMHYSYLKNFLSSNKFEFSSIITIFYIPDADYPEQFLRNYFEWSKHKHFIPSGQSIQQIMIDTAG